MLDHSEENRMTTVIMILVIIAVIVAMFVGLSGKSKKSNNCLAIGGELIDQGGRNEMSEKKYLEYKRKIKAACSKKVAQDFLLKAER